MNSIVVCARFTYGHLDFDPSARVELLFRSALAGTTKSIALGFRFVQYKNISEVIWFDSRISALEICTNYKKARRKTAIDPRDWATEFVEALVHPGVDGGLKNTYSAVLEKLASSHFSNESVLVNFEPYSYEDDAKVDVFVNYRRHCLSTSVQMGMLLPFLKSDCFCSGIKADRYCILCSE